MAKRQPLAPDEVRVVVLGAARNGRAVSYRRRFVGITVAEAIRRLDSNDKSQGGLPHDLITMDPYFVNGEQVPENSDRVLEAGDELKADDP